MKKYMLAVCTMLFAVALCPCAAWAHSPQAQQVYTPTADTSQPSGSQSYHPLTIIGGDDRVTVSDTSLYPYSAIAFMEARATCGCSWQGSGFMVLPDVLLTAGHCLCCTTHQQPADRIDFYFGYQRDGSYAYRYSGAWDSYYGTTFPGGYTEENMEQDYGIVRFAESVGNRTGYFGMKVKSDSEFETTVLRVAGYRDGLLKYDNGKARVTSAMSVRFYADTLPGNSGCPVYDGEVASAICIAQNDDSGYNVGHRINQDLFLKVFSMTKSGIKPGSTGPGDGGAEVIDPYDTKADGYVLPQSATYLYSREELSVLDDWGLALARNEIPARHGYIFAAGRTADYFAGKSWYKGTMTGEEFRSIVGILNYVEEANVQTILGLETERNSPYRPEAGEAQVIDPSQTGKDGYVLPQSNTHYYTKAELSRLTDWGLAVARNEIPARHGYLFKGGDFEAYFEAKNWYRGTLTGEEYRRIANIQSDIENANVDMILAIEKERNSPYRPKV